MEVLTKSAKETKALGKKIAATLKGGEILALKGELGSGKTTFVQGLAKGLKVKQRIISPTFILVREYEAGRKKLFHIDLYRIQGDIEMEIKSLGLEELWENDKNIVVIEWADKIKKIIPKNATWMEFEMTGGNKRKIKFNHETIH